MGWDDDVKMSVSYDITDKKGNVSRVRNTACFSGMFPYGLGPHAEEGDDLVELETAPVKFRAWFWNMGEPKAGNYFIEQFVLKSLTDRIKEGVFSYHNEKPEAALELPSPYWLTLDVDLTKITANDLYILLVLFRYPQENPNLTVSFRKLVEEEKKSISEAFVLAHSDAQTGYGHLMLNYNTPYFIKGGGKFPKDFSFKHLWDNLPKAWKGNKQSYSKYRHKNSSINPHFKVYNEAEY